MTGTKTDAEEDGIRIAFLILCHADPVHIARLVGKLIQHYRFEAFIHVDDKVNIAEFSRRLPVSPRVHLSKIRFPIFWGGFNSVEATLALMKLARETREFDRYVLLQGADYPLMSNEAIVRFFSAQASTEFIRA